MFHENSIRLALYGYIKLLLVFYDPPPHTHTHIYISVCACVFVCVSSKLKIPRKNVFDVINFQTGL